MKAYVLLADGFEEIEALATTDILRRAEIEVFLCSIDELQVKSSSGTKVLADLLIDEVKEYDILITPGGMPGSSNLKNSKKVISLIKKANEKNKFIASICASPIVLDEADVLKDKNYTCYPGFEKEIKTGNYKDERVVVDSKIITAKGPATTFEFAYEIVNQLKGNEMVEKLKRDMIYGG